MTAEREHLDPSITDREVAEAAEERTKVVRDALLSWPEFTKAAAEAVLTPRDVDPRFINVSFTRNGNEYTVSSGMTEGLVGTLLTKYIDLTVIRGLDYIQLAYPVGEEVSGAAVGSIHAFSNEQEFSGLKGLPLADQLFPEFFPPAQPAQLAVDQSSS